MVSSLVRWLLLALGIGSWLLLFVMGPWVFVALVASVQFVAGGAARGALVPGLRLGELGLAIAALGAVLSPWWKWELAWRSAFRAPLVLYVLGCAVIPILLHVVIAGGSFSGFMEYAAPLKAALVYAAIAGSNLPAERLLTVVRFSIVVLCFTGLVAFLQYLNVPWIWSVLVEHFPGPHVYLNITGRYHRATGLLSNWHGVGLSMVILVLLGWQCFHQHRKWIYLVAVLVGILGVIASGTFLAWLGTIGSVVLLAVVSGRGGVVKKASLLGVALIGVAAIFLLLGPLIFPERFGTIRGLLPESAYGRLYAWLFLFLPVIREHVWFGYGAELPNVGYVSDDSQIIGLLLKGGLVALAAWAVALAWIIRRARLLLVDDETGLLMKHVLVLSVVLAGASILQSFFDYTGVAEWYWSVLAMSAVAVRSSGQVAPYPVVAPSSL